MNSTARVLPSAQHAPSGAAEHGEAGLLGEGGFRLRWCGAPRGRVWSALSHASLTECAGDACLGAGQAASSGFEGLVMCRHEETLEGPQVL